MTDNSVRRDKSRIKEFGFCRGKDLIERFKTVFNTNMTYAFPNGKGVYSPNGVVHGYTMTNHSVALCRAY